MAEKEIGFETLRICWPKEHLALQQAPKRYIDILLGTIAISTYDVGLDLIISIHLSKMIYTKIKQYRSFNLRLSISKIKETRVL